MTEPFWSSLAILAMNLRERVKSLAMEINGIVIFLNVKKSSKHYIISFLFYAKYTKVCKGALYVINNRIRIVLVPKC